MTDELDRVAESFAEAWAYGFDEEADHLAGQAFDIFRDRHPEQEGPDVPVTVYMPEVLKNIKPAQDPYSR